MLYFSADFIFPIFSPPVTKGVVAVDDHGFVREIIRNPDEKTVSQATNFEGIICPGFINSHCHLELSFLKGKTSLHQGLPQFISEIDGLRRQFPLEEIQRSIEHAEDEMLNNGIVGAGDICNSDHTFSIKKNKHLRYHNFIEALGFAEDKAEASFEKYFQLFLQAKKNDLAASITPHAPYSASGKLLSKICEFAISDNSILSIHNQENADENKMFTEGKGQLLERLGLLGIDISGWRSTGKNSLASIIDFLPSDNKILLVHNTFTAKNDLENIRDRISQFVFCFCPSANLYIENRLPDIGLFMREKCKITIGTDSLASNQSLSILEELKKITSAVPEISLENLLTWATKNGADFFGWEELGTLEPGKKPGLNLINNIDLVNFKLTAESEVRKLI